MRASTGISSSSSSSGSASFPAADFISLDCLPQPLLLSTRILFFIFPVPLPPPPPQLDLCMRASVCAETGATAAAGGCFAAKGHENWKT